jgi:hypothetical protein
MSFEDLEKASNAADIILADFEIASNDIDEESKDSEIVT